MMEQQTYWLGKPCEAKKVTVIVDRAPTPVFWYANLEGNQAPAVEVSWENTKFYLYDGDGMGWRKVTQAKGLPSLPHRLIRVKSVVGYR